MQNEIVKLHKLGFGIHWLRSKSKVPVEKNWSTGPRKTLKQLEESEPKNANVGVRPGLPSALGDGYYMCIIDCDVKSGNEAHNAEMEKALASVFPEYYLAPSVISGRNKYSRHLYVRVNELKLAGRYQIAESAHKVKYLAPSKKEVSSLEKEKLTAKEIDQGYRLAKAWEITFMGDGAQVVLPPSIHPDSGFRYQWKGSLPSSIDDFPEFNPTKEKVRLSKGGALSFELVDSYPVFELPISERIMEVIIHAKDDGRYNSDRSSMLMACINAMVGKRIDDNIIVSVLSDPENAISEKPLEKGSRMAAARWLLPQVKKARAELATENDFGTDMEIVDHFLTDEEAQAQDDEMMHWTDRLDRNKTDNRPKNTKRNRILFLTKGCEPKTLRYNQFNQQVIYGAEPPWGLKDKIYKDNEVENLDIIAACHWLSEKFKVEIPEQDMWSTMQHVAMMNRFHPVRAYIKSLSWDGEDRLDNWLFKYLDAVGDKKYVQAVGSKTLIAAVARIFHPGVKFDNVLVLEGGQGVGKSTAVRILASEEWFTDSQIDPNNKDTINTIHGKWIIEMAEMVPAHKSEAESLKAFISKTEDRARLAFERKAVTFPRQCIFIGSTNKDEYFQDETGNRRFWPVVVGTLQKDLLIEDRDQLWAEAYYRYQMGEPLWLDDAEVEGLAKVEQSNRMVVDEWQYEAQKFIEEHPDKEYYTVREVWDAICGLDGFETSIKSFAKHDQMRVGKILKVLGLNKVTKRISGMGVAKVWVKP
jgi:predicted P-loop ATPase